MSTGKKILFATGVMGILAIGFGTCLTEGFGAGLIWLGGAAITGGVIWYIFVD